MKRVTQGGDINFNVADVRGLGDNYAFRFYTTDSCKYIVKVDGDAVDDIIRLEWDELKTLGDGVLNYCGENLEPDEEYSDATFNRTFGGTTQWYIVTSCSGGGGGSSEEISELSDRLDAEIERSTEKDEELEDAIDNTYTKAEVDRLIAEAEMGGDVPAGVVIDPNYVHTDNNYTTAEKSKLAGLSNYNDTALSDRITATETALNNTYRKNETYSQSEIDEMLEDIGGVLDTLNSESTTEGLSANQGHVLKEKINYVYGRVQALFAAMGEIAFWNGKPANLLPDLDWGDTVKHTVTIVNNVTHSAITSNGVPVSGSIQVDENSTLTLVIAPDSTDYTISNVTANGGTVTDNQDGTFTVVVNVTTSDVTLTINGTTTPTVVNYNISYGTLTHCQTTTAPTTIASDSTATIVFSVDTDYELLQSNINVVNASIVSFSSNTLVIGNATNNVTVSATATAVVSSTKFLKGYYLEKTTEDTEPVLRNSAFHLNGVETNPNLAELCATSEYIHVPAPSEPASSLLFSVWWGYITGTAREHPPIQWAVYSKDQNGNYTYIGHRVWDQASKNKTDRGLSGTQATDALAAYNAGNLYLRSTIGMNSEKTALEKTTTYGIMVNSDVLFLPVVSDGVPSNYTLVEPEDWTLDVMHTVSYGTMTNCQTTTAPTTIGSNGIATIVFSVDTGYELLQSNISVTNASIVSFSDNTLVIGSATGNVSVSATATSVSAE